MFSYVKKKKKKNHIIIEIAEVWQTFGHVFNFRVITLYFRTKHKHGKDKWFLIRYGQSEHKIFIKNQTPSKQCLAKWCRKDNMYSTVIALYYCTQRAHDVYTTSPQRRCNVMMFIDTVATL